MMPIQEIYTSWG